MEFLEIYKAQHSGKTFRKKKNEKTLSDEVAELGKDWIMKDLECHAQEFGVYPEIRRAAIKGIVWSYLHC